MNVLGEYIEQQMRLKEWVDHAGKLQQIKLVHASGLTKQRVSRLLSDRPLTRMIGADTIAGLAKAFGVDERDIKIKVAEANGVPVDQQFIRTAHDEPSEALLEILLERERRRKVRNGTSDHVSAPNQERATKDAGNMKVSGETGTFGELRDPRRSHGSDSNDPEHANPGRLL